MARIWDQAPPPVAPKKRIWDDDPTPDAAGASPQRIWDAPPLDQSVAPTFDAPPAPQPSGVGQALRPRGFSPYVEAAQNPASIGMALASKFTGRHVTQKTPNDPSEILNIPFEAVRGAASAREPVPSPAGDLDIPRTALKSAYKGIIEPDKTPSYGGQFQQAYPNTPWLLSGLAGTFLDAAPLFLGGKETVAMDLIPSSYERAAASAGEGLAAAARRDPKIFKEELARRMRPEAPAHTPDEVPVAQNVQATHDTMAAQAAADSRPTAEEHQAVVQGLETKLNYQHDPATGDVVKLPQSASVDEVAQAEASKQALANGDFKLSGDAIRQKASQAINLALSAHRAMKYAAMPPFDAHEALERPIGDISEQNNLRVQRFHESVFEPLSQQASDLTTQLEGFEEPGQRIAVRDNIDKIRKTIEQEANNVQTGISNYLNEIKESALQYARGHIDLTKEGWVRFEQDLSNSLSGDALHKNWKTPLKTHLDTLIKKYEKESANKGKMKTAKTVYSRVVQMGRIHPDSITRAGYHVKEDFREHGLGFLLSNTGKDFSHVAAALVSNNEIPGYKEGDSESEALMSALKSGLRLYGHEKEASPYERRYFDPENPDIRYKVSDLGFFSNLERTIEEKMPNSASPDQVRGILKNSGVKQEEMDWLDIDGHLAGKDKILKSDLLDFIRSNNVKVEEVVKGDGSNTKTATELVPLRQAAVQALKREDNLGYDLAVEALNDLKSASDVDRYEFTDEKNKKAVAKYIRERERSRSSPTKFSSYQLPGGENYKELLLTLPESPETAKPLSDAELSELNKIANGPYPRPPDVEARYLELGRRNDVDHGSRSDGNFKSSHFDEPNVLAHVRFNERTDSEGKKVLFIEEIQSDWHQKGRREGYGEQRKITEEKSKDTNGNPVTRYRIEGSNLLYPTRGAAQRDLSERSSAVPNAPFKKTWHELALKRMLRYAAENGFDKIAWTTGEQQAERYDLSKQISKIGYTPNNDGTFDVSAFDPDGKIISNPESWERMDLKLAENTFGKEIAGKMKAKEGRESKVFPEDPESSSELILEANDLKVGGEGMKGFYDQIIPSFLNKYTKKWGGRVSETKIDGEGKQNREYQGPEYPMEKLRAASKIMHGHGNIYESPFTGVRQEFVVTRVSPTGQLDDMIKNIESGMPFKEAAAKQSIELSEILGGKLKIWDTPTQEKVHSLDITPSMKKSVIQEGQPLFKKGTPSGPERDKTIAAGRALFEKLAPKNVALVIEGNLRTTDGRKALGWFQQYGDGQGLAKVDPSADIEVYHHELTHSIFNLTYKKAARQAILDEVKDAWDIANDKDAEEAIADEAYKYHQWTESGKDPNAFFGRRKFEGRTFSDKLKAFTKSIVDAIKRWFNFSQDKAKMSKLRKFYKEMYAGRRGTVSEPKELMAAKTKFKDAGPIDAFENPIMKGQPEDNVYIKSLQEDLRRVSERIKAGQKEEGLGRRRDYLIRELNRLLSPHNKTEAGKELSQFIKQADFFDTELPPGGAPLLGTIDAKKLKDISGIEASLRDVYRNFKDVFPPKDFGVIKLALLDHLDTSRGKFWDMQKSWADELQKTVVKKLGINPGSKESAAVQRYGEGEVKYDEDVTVEDKKTGTTKVIQKSLVSQFGKKKADAIVEADSWFRVAYDDLLERVNSSIARIYPGQADKLVPKMSRYYRHFREFSNLAGLLNIFDTPANIASKMAGISETSKPLSRWLSFGQERLGIATEIDAVKGFIDYLNAASYATHISPNIPRFRQLAKELRLATAKDPLMKEKMNMLYEAKRAAQDGVEKEEIQGKIEDLTTKDHLNTFITFLDDFAGDLAGKTNPYFDRVIQKVLGRKPIAVVNWINNRTKANVVLGNVSSAVAQLSNLPQAVAKTKLYFILGMGDSLAQIGKPSPAMAKSIFLKSRYGDALYDKFDRGVFDHSRNAAKWLMTVLDKVATRVIWNAFYEQAKAGHGEDFLDPVKYADRMTREMVAGRGVGEVPLMQKSKAFQLTAPFMVEVQNLWWVLGDTISERDFSALVVFVATAFVFNAIMDKIIGHRVVFDPLNAAIDASQPGLEPAQRMGRLIGEILSNAPGGNLVESQYPEYGFNLGFYKMPTRQQFFGESDTTRYGKGLLTEGLSDPLFKLLPSWGGNQLKKAFQGNTALNKGSVDFGKKSIHVTDSVLNRIIATAFGKYAIPEVKDYLRSRIDLSALSAQKRRTQERLYKLNLKDAYKAQIEKEDFNKAVMKKLKSINDSRRAKKLPELNEKDTRKLFIKSVTKKPKKSDA